MNISLNKETACRILRELRKRGEVNPQLRSDAVVPDPGPGRSRWSNRLLRASLPPVVFCQPEHPVDVVSPVNCERPRIRCASNTIYGQGIPRNAFVRADNGITISSPELLFLEMGAVMSPVVQALLGFELCGTFSRDPLNPRDGDIAFFVEPVTSVERIRHFLDETKRSLGLSQSRLVADWVLDNAWSPREAIIALLMHLPAEQLGYGFEGITLNKRVSPWENHQLTESRVPDITIGDTGVHVNYDGEIHLSDRGRYVDDRRRDRELSAHGETVLIVTKEDLYEDGGLDRVMWLAVEAIEGKSGVRLDGIRATLENRDLAACRQRLIWSLLPGERGRAISKELAGELSEQRKPGVH